MNSTNRAILAVISILGLFIGLGLGLALFFYYFIVALEGIK